MEKNKLKFFLNILTKHYLFFLEPYNFFLHNLESSNFLRICEYIERKTPSKNILEFHKQFSSRSHHKLFLDHPVDNLFRKYYERNTYVFTFFQITHIKTLLMMITIHYKMTFEIKYFHILE